MHQMSDINALHTAVRLITSNPSHQKQSAQRNYLAIITIPTFRRQTSNAQARNRDHLPHHTCTHLMLAMLAWIISTRALIRPQLRLFRQPRVSTEKSGRHLEQRRLCLSHRTWLHYDQCHQCHQCQKGAKMVKAFIPLEIQVNHLQIKIRLNHPVKLEFEAEVRSSFLLHFYFNYFLVYPFHSSFLWGHCHCMRFQKKNTAAFKRKFNISRKCMCIKSLLKASLFSWLLYP